MRTGFSGESVFLRAANRERAPEMVPGRIREGRPPQRLNAIVESMPTLLEETDIKLDFADLAKRHPVVRPHVNGKSVVQAERAAGVHQSGVLQYIARAIKILKPDERDEEEYPLIWALGQAWEEFAASLYPEMEWQPGEVELNGIWRTCDGLNTADAPWLDIDGEPMLEEFKATYKRLRTGAEFLKEWMWMHQGRGYCSAYQVRLCRWHVFYVKGDYQTFGPVYRRYLVRFTDQEIEQTEAMLVKNRDHSRAEGAING